MIALICGTKKKKNTKRNVYAKQKQTNRFRGKKICDAKGEKEVLIDKLGVRD